MDTVCAHLFLILLLIQDLKAHEALKGDAPITEATVTNDVSSGCGGYVGIPLFQRDWA